MKNYKIPYEIGTDLIRKNENGKHIDQVYQYIIDKQGLSVILMLDVYSMARLSPMISINELILNWDLTEKKVVDFERELPKQKALKKKNIIINKSNYPK